MEQELKQALGEVISAVRRTEAFRQYEQAHHAIEADKVLCHLLKQYESVQLALQTAVLSQTDPDEEDVNEFRRLNLVLMDSEKASEYLMAKMKYEHSLSEAFEYLSGGLELSLSKREEEA